MQFESNTVVVDALRLHYLRCGEGRPILMLHGWPTHSFIWRNLMPALSEFGAAYALDLPGFGWSDKPLHGEYTFTWFSRYVEGFINALDLNGITLIGHDIGAIAGLLWCIRNTSKSKAIVIMNAPIYAWRTRLDWFSQLLLGTLFVGRLLVSPTGLKVLLQANVVHKGSMPPTVINRYQAPFRSATERRLLRRTIVKPLAVGRRHELATLAKQVAGLGIPTAIIYGATDGLCARHMEEFSKQLVGASVVSLPSCGHFLQEDCPERLEKAVVEFLRRVLV